MSPFKESPLLACLIQLITEQLFNTYTRMHTPPPRSYTVSQTLNDFLLLGPKFKIFKTIHSEEINSPKVSEGAFKPQGTSAHWEGAFPSKQHDCKRSDRPARLQHHSCCTFLICSLGVGVLPHVTCSCLCALRTSVNFRKRKEHFKSVH